MEIISLDENSPAANSSQIRDFTNRILLGAAERFNGSDEWTETALHLHTSEDTYSEEFLLEATLDPMDGSLEYSVGRERIQPFDESWQTSAASDALGIMYIDPYDYDDEGPFVKNDKSDEKLSETEIPIEELGFYGVENSYKFFVPYGNYPAIAHRSVTVNYYDSYRSPVNIEVVNHIAAYTNLTTSAELENLFRFEEMVLDSDTVERELSTITIHDLDVVLGGMKRFGLVTARSITLSKRVR